MTVNGHNRQEIELSTVHSALLADEISPLSEVKFREDHNFQPPKKKALLDSIQGCVTCSKNDILNFIPILKWLPRYKFKESFLYDVIAGVTVSVLQIPHGLAFAPLAYVEPVVGLYMAVFPIFMYIIFGTSRHLSLGMMGILIMMVGAIVGTHADFDVSCRWNDTDHNCTGGGYGPLEVATAITLTIGIWQVILGFLQLGSLCVLLSNSLVSGLTTAASIHILIIQLKNIFGISITMANGPLKVFYILIEVGKHIHESNYVCIVLALSFFIFLMVFNELIKPLIAKRCSIPIPMEFILIGVSIALSEFLQLEEKHAVQIVGSVPSGLPPLTPPPFSLIPTIAFDSLIIALVSISFNISLGKVFAKKGGYELHDNQELVAYGFSNIVGGFFQCLPVSASLSRSMVQFAVGGKTELAHLISLTSVLLMLLFLGPLFGKVPLSVLAAIVMATLKGLLIQVMDLPKMWRASKMDGAVWLITFSSVVLVDLDYGIGMGLIASVLTLLVRVCQNDILVINQLPNSNRFVHSKRYAISSEKSVCLVLKLIGHVNFFNCTNMSQKLLAEFETFREGNANEERNPWVVLDLSAVPSLDPSAVSEMISVVKILNDYDSQVYLTSCSAQVYCALENSSFFDKFPKGSVFLNLSAAVDYLSGKKIM